MFKILDITHFYSERAGGGIKSYLLEKSKFLSQRKIEHSLILPGNSDRIQIVNHTKFYFIKSPPLPFLKHYRFILNRRKLIEILSKEKSDIVEVGSPYLLPVWINKYKKILKYKTVGFFHSNIEGTFRSIIKKLEKLSTLFSERLIKKEYGDFNIIVTPSKYVEKYLNSIGINNTLTVYLGIDVKVFKYRKKDKELRRIHKIPEDKIVLVYVGRLSLDKNILELADIYNSLDPNRYHMVIIGSGELEKKFVKNLKGSFTFLGFISDKEKLAQILSVCDIFVTPSKIETFGLSVVEAQACGLPVVGFRAGSLPEVVYKKELLARTKEEFIINIKNLDSSYFSDVMREEISTNIRKRFPWEKTFNKMLEIYYDLLHDTKECVVG